VRERVATQREGKGKESRERIRDGVYNLVLHLSRLSHLISQHPAHPIHPTPSNPPTPSTHLHLRPPESPIMTVFTIQELDDIAGPALSANKSLNLGVSRLV
jgi:hypothetical protein